MKSKIPLTIGHVIGIHAWLGNEPPSDVQAPATLPEDDADLVLAWWQAVADADDPLAGMHTLVNSLSVAVGAFTGISVASVALTYTGAYPVNILMLLAILVGLPGLTLVLSLLARLLARRRHAGLGSLLMRSLGALNRDYPDFLSTNLWRYQSALYWHSTSYLQHATLAFLVAAGLTFVCLIAFSDIAFGWSSTLDIQAQSVYALTQFLSFPWQIWLPAAHPTLELVEASRFYRMNPDNHAALLGQWWQFIGLCIVVWAIVPRLIMAWVAHARIKATNRTALFSHPEVTALIRQLRQSEVVYQSAPPAAPEMHDPEPVREAGDQFNADVTIAWNGVRAADSSALHIDMGATPDAQTALLSQLPEQPSRICILVKGWEPPLLEFLDFIEQLRVTVGPAADIAVHPLALPEDPLGVEEVRAWRTTLGKLHDARVYVEASA
ncbi:MAG: DUF2868 domain-containing protein [Pseudomonadota bacterium]